MVTGLLSVELCLVPAGGAAVAGGAADIPGCRISDTTLHQANCKLDRNASLNIIIEHYQGFVDNRK